MKYILSRKAIDLLIIEWEKDYLKSKIKESLPRFIARKQAIYLLQIFIEKGFSVEDAKKELKKLLDKEN